MGILAFSTNSRQRIADQHIDDTTATVEGGYENRTRRLLADFADDLRFSSARCQAQSIDGGIGVLGRNHGQELALVRNVQRIEAQQFTSAAHRVAHGNLILKKNHSQSTIARQFVQRCRRAATSGIAHPTDSRASRPNQSLDQRQHGAGIGAKVGFKIEFAARQQNRDAVIANGPGEQNPVAQPAPIADQC